MNDTEEQPLTDSDLADSAFVLSCESEPEPALDNPLRQDQDFRELEEYRERAL